MALQAIPSGQVRFDSPAPCDVFDAQGKLLIRKGSQAANFMQFQAWANEGFFRKPDVVAGSGQISSPSLKPTGPGAVKPAAAAPPAAVGAVAPAAPRAPAAAPAKASGVMHAALMGGAAPAPAAASPRAQRSAAPAAAAAPSLASTQAALQRTKSEIAASSAQVKPSELLGRWDALIATEAKTEGQLHRISLAELGDRWLISAEQASQLDDSLPDLAHYRLVRAIHESAKHAPNESVAAQHLLAWLCTRRVALALNWSVAELRWMQDLMSTARWVGQRRPGAPLLEFSGFVPQEGVQAAPMPARAAQRMLLAWLGQEPPASDETVAEPALKAGVPDLLGVWVGACVVLNQRQPSCIALPAQWMKLAEANAPGWRRCAQAAGVVLKKVWGACPPGTFVGLANGDTGVVVKAGATVNECLVLRICSREGSNYTELPRRNAAVPDHILKGILPVGEISVRVSHEKVVERGYS